MRATQSHREPGARQREDSARALASVPSLLSAGNCALARALAQRERLGGAGGGVATLLRREAEGAAAGGVLGAVTSAIGDAVAAASAAASGQIAGSVGRGGKNVPADVALVRELLRAAGYADEDLDAAIEGYQREVVGLRRPDGRVDPNGRTLRALRGGGGAAATRATTAASGGPVSGGGGAAPPEAPPDAVASAPTTTAAEGAAAAPPLPAPTTSTGPADAARIAAEIAALATKAKGVRRSGTEEVGKGRDELVAKIAELRKMIAGLKDADVKAGFYHQLNAISPSYTQGTNMDLLETPEPTATRTCNITSLSMALEGLGKSPSDFKGNKKAVAAAGRVFAHVVAKAQDHADAELDSLRMSDFMQLAAIAEELGDAAITDQSIQDAAAKKEVDDKGREKVKGAWNSILSIYFLKGLAQRFGASAEVVIFNLTSNDPADPKQRKKHASDDFSALRGVGSKHRTNVEKMTDLRNKRDELAALPATSTKRRAELEKEILRNEKAVAKANDLSEEAQAEDEAKIPLQEYKERVQATVGVQVDRGAQVVVGLSGHYVRLQSIEDDHVVVDDPARPARANRKVTWEEARAMGYFQSALVINS